MNAEVGAIKMQVRDLRQQRDSLHAEIEMLRRILINPDLNDRAAARGGKRSPRLAT